jgi:hypothetical protein
MRNIAPRRAPAASVAAPRAARIVEPAVIFAYLPHPRKSPHRGWLAGSCRALPVGLAVAVLLALALIGCGSERAVQRAARTSPRHQTRLVARSSHLRGDEDDDEPHGENARPNAHDNDADFDDDSPAKQGKAYHDGDDREILAWGHAANAADRTALATLLARYYESAARDDGATGCSLISPVLAEAAPRDYGSGAGPAYLKGSTCSAVMSKLFAHDRLKFAGPLRVTGVRIEGEEGIALIGSPMQPASSLRLSRVRGRWQVDALEGTPLP